MMENNMLFFFFFLTTYNKIVFVLNFHYVANADDKQQVMSAVSPVPITAKFRIGKKESAPIIHTRVAPHVHKWGVSAVSLHG